MATIGFLAFASFLAKNLFEGHYTGPSGNVGIAIHLASTFSLLIILAVLLHTGTLTPSHLRHIEVAMVLCGSVFFGWYQFNNFRIPPAILQLPAEQSAGFISDLSDSCMLRWFAMIVLYGITVPNDLRRCCVMVAFMVSIPLAMTILAGQIDGTLRFFGDALVETVMWLVIAAMAAIYCSHRLNVLWREALTGGRRLGQYRLIRLLGKGAMGEVHVAEHPMLRRICAIKTIQTGNAADHSKVQRFIREVQATARLSHWNNVRILDYGQDEDGTFFYVMDYLDGMDLHVLVEKYGPQPPERVVHFLNQICDALHEAHSIRLIHRDIKPSNIMACRRGGVHDILVLLDYGIVKSPHFDGRGDLTGDHIVGTPDYMSPEQARGWKVLDARSDIYSVGGVSYYLLTGRPPLVRENYLQLLHAHISDQPEPPSSIRAGIPEDLERVILKCLEKEPSRRFQDVKALKTALAGCHCARHWTEERAQTWWNTVPQVSA